MTERGRNLAVGVTVLVGLLLLGGMIVVFAGLPWLLERGYLLHLRFPRTADAKVGDMVHLSGLEVGRIADIAFTGGDPRRGVTIAVRIKPNVRVPGSAVPVLHSKGFVGGAYLNFEQRDRPAVDPRSGEPMEFFPTDYPYPIEGVIPSTELIPKTLQEDLGAAMKALAKAGQAIDRVFGATAAATGPAETGPAPHTAPSRPADPLGLHGTLARLNRTLDAVHAVLGSQDNQANFRRSLANLASAAEATREAMAAMKDFAVAARKTAEGAGKAAEAMGKTAEEARGRIDELGVKLIENAEQISRLMATINRVARGMDAGEGTIGKVMRDPELYNALLQATRDVSGMVQDLRQLVRAWKESGVGLKLK